MMAMTHRARNLTAAIGITVGVFVVDLHLPGYAIRLFYIVPFLLAADVAGPLMIVSLAGTSTVLVGLDFLLEPQVLPTGVVVFNDFLSISVLWIVAVLLIRRQEVEEERNMALHGLRLRVNELVILHHTARALQDQQKKTPEVLQEIVGLLPGGWQYPQIAAARVALDAMEWRTPGFGESPWAQQADLIVAGAKRGQIEVRYMEERPPAQEGPFLAEERSLLNSLADMLRTYLERREADEAVRRANAELERRVAERTAELVRANADLQAEVTEREQAVEVWRASEERYRTLIEFAPEAVAVRRGGRWIYINPAGVRLLGGATVGELIGQDVMRFVHPADRAEVGERMRQVEEQRLSTAPMAFKMVQVDGGIINVEAVETPTMYQGERSALAILRDITEHRRAAEERERLLTELAGEKARWQATVESMLDPVTVCDAEGKATYMNRAYSHLVDRQIRPGLDLDEHPAFYQLYRGDGSLFPPEELPLQRAALRGEEVRNVEVVQRTPGGQELIALWNAAPLYDGVGRPQGAVAVGRDITALRRAEQALRRSEERYRTLAEHFPDIIERFDRAGVNLYVNRAGAEAHGTAAEAVIGKRIEETGMPESAARRWRACIREVVETGQERQFEEELRRENNVRFFHSRLTPERAQDGTIASVLAISRDVTERKRAEESLRRAQEALERNLRERIAALVGSEFPLEIDPVPSLSTEGGIRRLSQLLARRAGEVAALDRIGAALTSSLELEAVLRLLVNEVRGLVATEGAAVLLYDPATDELRFEALEGSGVAALRGRSIPVRRSLGGWVFRERQAALVNDPQSDPRAADSASSLAQAGIRSLLAVPLIAKGAAIGVLATINKLSGDFTEADLQSLAGIASAASVAIENAGLYRELRVQRDQLRALAAQAMRIREEETKRIARDLHDEIGQALTSLLLGLQGIATLQSEEEMRRRAMDLRALVAKPLGDVQRLIRVLRPDVLEDFGLATAVERYAEGYAAASGVHVDCYVHGLEGCRLPPSVETTLYRAAQEALTNVAKHAKALHVSVLIQRRDGSVVLVVEDDGQGFERLGRAAACGGGRGIGIAGDGRAGAPPRRDGQGGIGAGPRDDRRRGDSAGGLGGER